MMCAEAPTGDCTLTSSALANLKDGQLNLGLCICMCHSAKPALPAASLPRHHLRLASLLLCLVEASPRVMRP